MNADQEHVWRQLNDWRSAAAHFRKWARRKGKAYVSWDPAIGEISTPAIEVQYWRRRVARMIREARRRERAKDWDWFFWLREYSTAVSATVRDGYRQYDKAIIRGGNAMKQVRALNSNANALRKAQVDARVLREFGEWRRKVVAALSGLTVAQQVRKYHIVQCPSPRDKRRLNALLKAGAVR